MTAIDTTRPSLTIVKSFGYRGTPEEFSNTYFMDGALPASPSSWKTLADNVIAEEKAIFPSNVTIVRAIGHQAGQSVAVWAYDYLAHSEEVAGTLTPPSASVPMPGDSAVWIRWSTDALTSKGKPIFLRSYYHGLFQGNTDTTNDLSPAAQVTAMQEYGDDWIAGFADGDAVVHHRAGPHGVAGLTALPSTYITTRTLERRGKRPTGA